MLFWVLNALCTESCPHRDCLCVFEVVTSSVVKDGDMQLTIVYTKYIVFDIEI